MASAMPLDDHTADTSPLKARQFPTPCFTNTQTRKEGDGKPKQKYLQKQLSVPIACDGKNACSVGESQVKSYSIGWSASISDPRGFTSAGFSVSETVETGSTWTCEGEGSDTVCVWYAVAHTEYEVRDWEAYTCGSVSDGWKATGEAYRITAPNSDNRGSLKRCVLKTCRDQGDEYWSDDVYGTVPSK
ncbi:hypothetical protein CkaCkLH20_03630 [Colletotrichum karsti]|uniref:Uncharacterized protein n=1 Tax=Colletotrichum karsti TaxID=1095194 RepID=A0A9P6LMR8_9PEZI|nr:uncharacterized protein CkaCkLH20_03630 [Colletotrichum karsti]KAF9878730.1 hypothetical protein CkaCkLH20_03630 [Colletotrichum karsti]